jgi:hypothetical protein
VFLFEAWKKGEKPLTDTIWFLYHVFEYLERVRKPGKPFWTL